MVLIPAVMTPPRLPGSELLLRQEQRNNGLSASRIRKGRYAPDDVLPRAATQNVDPSGLYHV
jgi:hypothetical protein